MGKKKELVCNKKIFLFVKLSIGLRCIVLKPAGLKGLVQQIAQWVVVG